MTSPTLQTNTASKFISPVDADLLSCSTPPASVNANLSVALSPVSRTPLMLAVLGGHTDCVHFLLEKGALPDTKDKRGRSALHRGVRPTR